MADDATLASIAKVVGSNIAPGYLTMLRGDPNAETTLGRYIPGGVQGVVGGVGGFAVDMANLLGNEIPKAAGYNTGLPHVDTPEFIQLAQQHHAGAAQAANELLPPVEPQNAPERVAADVTRGLTETGFPLPLGAATRFVPSAVRAAAGLIAPSAMAPVRAGVPIGATVGALSTLHEATKPNDTSEPEYTLPPEPSKQGVSAPTGDREYTLPPVASTQPTAHEPEYRLPDDVAALPPTSDISIPAKGDTSIPWAHVIEGLGAALGMAIAHRPVKSIWGTVTDAKRQVEYDAQREAVGLSTADPSVPKPAGFDETNPPPVPQVQLPGDTGFATGFNTRYFNENARMQQALAAYAESPEEAKAVKRVWGQLNDRLTAQGRAREFIETGIEPMTKVQLPALGRYARRYGEIATKDPELGAKINQTAQYGNELNNRDIMLRDALTKGPISADDPSLRYSLWEIPTSEMRTRVAANMNDPTVRSYIDEYNSIKRAYLQHVVDRGLITQQTADNLISLHPDHISRVDPDGRIVDLIGPRELTTRGGPSVVSQNFVETMMDQLPQLMRSAEKNYANQMAVETFLNGQAAKPKMPIVISEIPERAPGGGPLKDDQRRLLNVGYGTGARTFEVHDVAVHNLMTKGNDFLPNTLQGVAHATQMLQSFTTGAGSLFAGRLFGLATNLPRNILAGSTQRPTGMAGGITDRVLQSATGGRVGLRVADPLSIAGSAYEIAAGSAAMFTKGMANILERNQAPGARLLRSMLGEHNTRAMIDAMNNVYARSNLSGARSEGAAGSGQGARSRVAATESNTLPTSLRDISAALKKPYNPAQTNIPELYHGKGMSFAIRARAFVNDLNNLMNDAYHLHVRRLNPGMDTMERAYEVNQLVGAPGQTGQSRALRGWGTVVPYLNPSLQGSARAVRAVNEAPIGTVFGKLATYSMLIAAEQWLAMQGGPEHVDHLLNVLTPRQLAGNVFLMGNTNDPNDYGRIPAPQEDWWIFPMIRAAMQHVFSIAQTMTDEPYRVQLGEAFGQFFKSYMTKREAEGMLYGFGQLVDPILQMPAAVNALFNLGGMRYRGDTTNIIQGVLQGKPLLGQQGILTQPINDPYKLPGQDLSREGGDVGIVSAMMSSLFGAMYTTWSQIAGEVQHATSLGDTVSRIGDVLQERFRSMNGLGGSTLYPSANMISPRGSPEQQFVTNTMRNLKDVGSLLSSEKGIGFTRPGGEPIAMRGEPSLPQDPMMLELLHQASALHNYLQKNIQPHINDLDKLRQDIMASHEGQDVKRQIANKYATQIQAAYINAQEIIDKANEQASIMMNGSVDFAMPINWQGSALQFQAGKPQIGPEYRLP